MAKTDGDAPVRSVADYTLEDLSEAVKGPWRRFARWADTHLPEPETTSTVLESEMMEYEHGYQCKMGWGPKPFQLLPFQVFLRALSEVWGQEGTQRFVWPVIGKDLHSLTAPPPQVVLENAEKLDAALAEAESQILPDSFEEYGLTGPIFKRQRIARARLALQGPKGLEKSFWTEVREGVKEILSEFQGIDQAVREGRPLSESEQKLLAEYEAYGRVVPAVEYRESGAVSVRHVMEGVCGARSLESYDVVDCHVGALLAHVAYQVAAAWVRSQRWPRYPVICHAPSCGRHFYAGRANQRVCPGSRRCRAEWVRFQGWLKERERLPARDWDTKRLKEQFIKSYTPRR